MTTIDPHVAVTGAPTATEGRGLAAVADWVTTSDHKKIGRLFIGASLLFVLGISAVGAILGFERIDASSNVIDAGALPQLFAASRVVLTFGVLVPLMLGIALAVVPLQLGARSLAFPRLAAAGFWTWLTGLGLVVGSIAANGGPGGGDNDMVDLFLGAHGILVLGLLAAAISLAASVLTTRAPGMNMRRVPLFAWSVLVGSLGLILLLPVLIGTLVILYVDHHYGRQTFGGNYGINTWAGYAFTQPSTFVYAVPALGLLLEAASVASKRRLKLRGVAFAGLGLVAFSALAGVSQVTTGIRKNIFDFTFGKFLGDAVPYALFNILPLLGGVVVLGVAALAIVGGKPRISASLVFGLLGAVMILTGIAGNAVFLIGDAQLGGTVFEEGVWIYICYGAVLAALGAVAHWGPKLWGRTLDDKKVIPLALLGFLATVLAALPYYVAGFAKQPAGVTEFDYSGPQDLWNTLSAVGHLLMLLTVLAFIGLAVRSFTKGPLAGDDPWDGQTLEWATSSPAPANNFAEIHVVSSAEPLIDLKPATSGSDA